MDPGTSNQPCVAFTLLPSKLDKNSFTAESTQKNEKKCQLQVTLPSSNAFCFKQNTNQQIYSL